MQVRHAFIICIAVEVGIIALGLATYGMNVEALQIATRFSGRFSLVIFSVMFLATDIASIHRWLSTKPFHIFAFISGIHLLELLFYMYLSSATTNTLRITGGAIVNTLIFLMPMLADRHEKGLFDVKLFKVAQILFQYAVWLLFFLTYLPRVNGTLSQVGGTYLEHIVLLGWVSLMLGMKLPSVMFGKRRISR